MSAGTRTIFKAATIGLLALSLAGCAERIRSHGYVPNDEDLSAITVGVDTRDTVREQVGAPSAGGLLEGGDYYYVKSQVRHYGAKRPEVIDRQVLAISFDEAGVVQNIERFGLQDGKVVVLSRRVTETTVTNNGFLRRLLGAIGRIAPGGPGSE